MTFSFGCERTSPLFTIMMLKINSISLDPWIALKISSRALGDIAKVYLDTYKNILITCDASAIFNYNYFADFETLTIKTSVIS